MSKAEQSHYSDSSELKNNRYIPPLKVPPLSASYVHERHDKSEEALKKQGVIDMDASLGQSPFGPPDFFKPTTPFETNEHVYKSLWDLHIRELTTYHNPERVRQCEKGLKEQFELQKADVILGSSGSDGFLILITNNTLPGTQILGHGPQFPQMAKYAGDTYEAVQPSSFTVKEGVHLLKKKLQDDPRNDRIIYVCNPNTPLGDTVEIEDLRELAILAEKNANILLVDEAWGAVLEKEESANQLAEEYNSVIVVGSTSKIDGLPEAAIGYAVASPDLGKRLRQLLPPYYFRGPSLVIAEQLFTTPLRLEHLAKIKPLIREEKIRTLALLDTYGVPYLPTDERTPIVTIAGENTNFHTFLAQHCKLLAAEGSAFSNTHEAFDDRFVRVTIQPGKTEHLTQLLRVGYFMSQIPPYNPSPKRRTSKG